MLHDFLNSGPETDLRVMYVLQANGMHQLGRATQTHASAVLLLSAFLLDQTHSDGRWEVSFPPVGSLKQVAREITWVSCL
jgi:hypothetical protein